jgi:hypothetical protein
MIVYNIETVKRRIIVVTQCQGGRGKLILSKKITERITNDYQKN